MKSRLFAALAIPFIFSAVSLTNAMTPPEKQQEPLAANTFSSLIDKQGNISLPTKYRQDWSHIGSWIVEDENAPGYGFHDVYTQPEAVKKYLETKTFADGTVLVKEVRGIHSAPKTTGLAQWAGDMKVWFVMVKDTKGRFDNQHWQKGWGWALFEAKNPQKNVSEGFMKSCLGCHTPAANTDWVFKEGYPTLNE